MVSSDINKKFVRVEGSKSIINRMLILASLRKKPFTVHNFSSCTDVQTMVENYQKLGFEFERINTEFQKIFPPDLIYS